MGVWTTFGSGSVVAGWMRQGKNEERSFVALLLWMTAKGGFGVGVKN
jgi:hypothetical protein